MVKIEKNIYQLHKNIIKYSSIITILFILFSCCNEKTKVVYKYNSIEYKKKLKEFTVSLETAGNIASQLYFENHPNSKEYHFTLDIIFDEYYLFCESNCLYNGKTGQYFLSGIWVNGKTGKALYKNTNEYVKIHIDIPSSYSTKYSGTIIRK